MWNLVYIEQIGEMWRRHTDQLLKLPDDDLANIDTNFEYSSSPNTNVDNPSCDLEEYDPFNPSIEIPRRSTRIRKPPDRLSYEKF